jgi:cobalt/nickel transport system permease protein
VFDAPFADGQSFVHRRDPRVRLVTALFSAFCLAALRGLTAAGLGLALAVFVASIARLPWRPLLKRLLAVNIFMFFLWLTVPFSMETGTLFKIGPLTASEGGIRLAFLATLKTNAIMLLFISLAATMPLPVLGHALARLHCPDKLVCIFILAYRYIQTTGEEWRRMRIAASLRAFTPRFCPHTYKTLGNMLGILFVQSFERSSRIYEAMTLRGFSGRFQSVTMFRATVCDMFFVTLLCFALAGLVFLDLRI